MLKTVLLDSSFLIGLVSPDDQHHESANEYWKFFTDHGVRMYLSTIVASEFSTKQKLSNFPLQQLIVLPFNLRDAEMAGQIHIYRASKYSIGETGISRVQLKDDIKILAQLCANASVEAIVTGDSKMKGPFTDATTHHAVKKTFYDLSIPVNIAMKIAPKLFDKSKED